MTRYAHIVLTILFSFLILNPNVISQTHIPPVNVSGIWQKENSPYYIDGEIRIAYGDKLVIEPGVKVIFTGHYKFVVNGFLEAKGTPDDSIYFFPSDTSLGWHGIRFIEAEDSSLLEYCVLKYVHLILNCMNYAILIQIVSRWIIMVVQYWRIDLIQLLITVYL